MKEMLKFFCLMGEEAYIGLAHNMFLFLFLKKYFHI